MSRSFCKLASGFKRVSHVIFDLDGLILDTETIYAQAIKNVLKQYGKEYTKEVHEKILGTQATDLAQIIISLLELPVTTEEFLNAKLIEQEKLGLSDAQLMPDTERIYKSVISNITKKYGKEYTLDVMKKVLGTVQRDTCKIVVKELKLPISPEKFNEFFNNQSRVQLANVGFMPGAEKFITHLSKHNIPIAVATSSSKESYELKISKHTEFFKLFSHKVTGGSDPDVKHGKPHPDIFLVCAKRFSDNPDPSNCLVLEDAPNGVQAAVDAGMQCIMIPNEEMITSEMKQKATLILKSMEELKPEVFGLPSY